MTDKGEELWLIAEADRSSNNRQRGKFIEANQNAVGISQRTRFG